MRKKGRDVAYKLGGDKKGSKQRLKKGKGKPRKNRQYQVLGENFEGLSTLRENAEEKGFCKKGKAEN